MGADKGASSSDASMLCVQVYPLDPAMPDRRLPSPRRGGKTGHAQWADPPLLVLAPAPTRCWCSARWRSRRCQGSAPSSQSRSGRGSRRPGSWQPGTGPATREHERGGGSNGKLERWAGSVVCRRRRLASAADSLPGCPSLACCHTHLEGYPVADEVGGVAGHGGGLDSVPGRAHAAAIGPGNNVVVVAAVQAWVTIVCWGVGKGVSVLVRACGGRGPCMSNETRAGGWAVPAGATRASPTRNSWCQPSLQADEGTRGHQCCCEVGGRPGSNAYGAWQRRPAGSNLRPTCAGRTRASIAANQVDPLAPRIHCLGGVKGVRCRGEQWA
jgi:hypothetical protein